MNKVDKTLNKQIIKKPLSRDDEKRVEKAVTRVVKDYSEVLKLLGQE